MDTATRTTCLRESPGRRAEARRRGPLLTLGAGTSPPGPLLSRVKAQANHAYSVREGKGTSTSKAGAQDQSNEICDNAERMIEELVKYFRTTP